METILLQLKDIKGNSTIKGFEDQIILMSYQLSASLPIGMDTANTERTLGRPNFSEFTCSKMTDQSTTSLFAACAAGTKIGDAMITIGRNEGGAFMPMMKYVLKNAMVANVATAGSSELSDSLSFYYSAITTEYTQQAVDSTKKGTASFGWDLSTNQAISS